MYGRSSVVVFRHLTRSDNLTAAYLGRFTDAARLYLLGKLSTCLGDYQGVPQENPEIRERPVRGL